jgi:hypothetical protein
MEASDNRCVRTINENQNVEVQQTRKKRILKIHLLKTRE